MAFADIASSDFAAAISSGEFAETWTRTDADGTETSVSVVSEQLSPRELANNRSGNRRGVRLHVPTGSIGSRTSTWTNASVTWAVGQIGEDQLGVTEITIYRDEETRRSGTRTIV